MNRESLDPLMHEIACKKMRASRTYNKRANLGHANRGVGADGKISMQQDDIINSIGSSSLLLINDS